MKLHKCVEQDNLRPVLAHIYVDEKNIVATDAHVLVVIPKTHIEGMTELPKMFIKAKDWAKLIPLGKKFFVEYENGFLVSYIYQKVKKFSKVDYVKIVSDENRYAIIKPVLQENSEMGFPDYEHLVYNLGKPVEIDQIGLSLKKINQIKEGLGCDNISIIFYGKERAMIIKPTKRHDLEGRVGLLMPVLLSL